MKVAKRQSKSDKWRNEWDSKRVVCKRTKVGKNYQNNQEWNFTLLERKWNLKRKALFIKGVEISYHLYDYHKNGQKREEASYKNGAKTVP